MFPVYFLSYSGPYTLLTKIVIISIPLMGLLFLLYTILYSNDLISLSKLGTGLQKLRIVLRSLVHRRKLVNPVEAHKKVSVKNCHISNQSSEKKETYKSKDSVHP